MSTKSFTRSYAGGEISPLLYGRLDLAKNQTGLARCENFIVTPQGPIENRPGFQYVIRAKDTATPPCLIPFTYNSEQAFALEFGNLYIRFHTQGGTLLESAQAITGITQANPGVFTIAGHGYSNGQWVFLAAIGGMTALNGRWGIVANATANTFTLNDLYGAAISTAALPAYTAGGTASRVYEIATPYLAADLFDLHYVQSADVMTITHQSYAPRELRRLGATNWTLTSISFVPTIATPAAPAVVAGGPGGGTPIPYYYVTTAIAPGTLEESLASASGTDSQDLSIAGNYLAVTPAAVVGAVRYNVYKFKNGVYGYIGQTDGTLFQDANIEPDLSKTPPLSIAPFASENPRAASYFEQRRCFAGGGTNPQTVWLTRSGTENNLTYSIPTQDDDAITARIVAREANTVRHLVPLNDLLALTSGGVWRLAASDGGPITPASFSAKPQGYVGASNVQPVVTDSSVLYAPDRGSHVREVSYSWETQTYRSQDVAVLAPHLVDFKGITQLSYSKTPHQVLWAVRDDGTLLGLTHQPEHDVKAWHQHSTEGSFVSVCAIPEGDEDGIYVLVQRTINGGDYYYVERMHSRQFEALEDAFFFDSGATYSGAAATTITGLHHLEGEEVVALADGGVVTGLTVSGGSVTLSTAATPVHVGKRYNCDAQTMPLAIETAAAFGQGMLKNANEVGLRVYRSSGIQVGPNSSSLREYPQRTIADDFDSPPGLSTGMLKIKLDPKWAQDGSVYIRQANPLPLTVVAHTLEFATGG